MLKQFIYSFCLTLKFLYIFVAQSTAVDLFTSTADLQRALYTEKEIFDSLKKYIILKKAKLESLQSVVDNYREKDVLVHNSIEKVSNPIDTFKVIQRLMDTWKELEEKMRFDSTDQLFQHIYFHSQAIYPSQEDMVGVAVGLLRLQDTYKLETKDLANGVVMGKKISKELSALDCFEIGKLAYTFGDSYHTLIWMNESLIRSKRELSAATLEADVLEYLAFAFYHQGNVKQALKTTDRLFEIKPNHPNAKANIEWYENQLSSEGICHLDFRSNIPAMTYKRSVDTINNAELYTYEELCRNEQKMNRQQNYEFYCYYKKDRPYLLLAPFKVEIVGLDPLVVLFRDVLSDAENELIKELARPKLLRATVQNSKTGEGQATANRVSKSAWLKEKDSMVVERVNKRSALMTNLNMETAEDLQVANYGIGGHYFPHFDFAMEDDLNQFGHLNTGNRIATLLFYMSEVEHGGATVFINSKITIKPSMNDALFWYNLKRNGKGNLMTKHAACPVLLGVKWITNKWIHEKGQEFLRPCALKQDVNERYVGDLGDPQTTKTY